MPPLIKEIDDYLSEQPSIKFYSWMNGIKTKCWQLRIAQPTRIEQNYLASCWKVMDTVPEGVAALQDWRLS